MSTSYAEAIDEVKHRYLIGTVGAEPDDPLIEEFLRSTFRWLTGAVPPVRVADISVTDGVAQLPPSASLIYFVASEHTVLFQYQWLQTEGGIRIAGPAAGETVTVYYAPAFDFTSGSIDTSCIFGSDWLHEPAIVMCGMRVLSRLSQISPNKGGSRHLQAFRVDQTERDTLIAALRNQWQLWYDAMRQRSQERVALNELPLAGNPLRGFVNDSRLSNPLVGS